MSSFTELLKNPSEANRLAKYVIEENPDIENFEEFEVALKKKFSSTNNGQNALNFINDEESKLLFNSEVIQKAIEENIGREEYLDKFEEQDNFEVQRKVSKGEPTKKSDIIVVPIQRNFISRTNTGKEYKRGYLRFEPVEKNFLKVRKSKNYEPKKIIYEFNQHFKQRQRSESSLRTQLYRI